MNSNEESVFADNQNNPSERENSSQPAKLSTGDDQIKTGGDKETLNISQVIQPEKSRDFGLEENDYRATAKLDD